MKFIIKTQIVILITCMLGFSQDSTWLYTVDANLGITLNTYNENWIGGEAGSFVWVSKLDFITERKLTSTMKNENRLHLAFGQSKIQDKTDKKWSSAQKSTDLIDLQSILSLTLGGFIDPFVGVRAITQFEDARVRQNIRYFNPIKLTESFGAKKDFIKTSSTTWGTSLAGAVRQLIDRDTIDTLTLDFNTKTTSISSDGGIELASEFITNSKNNFLLSSKINIYEALISSKSESSVGTDFWRHPDVNWENSLTLNITKYIMINYYLQLLYDKELDNSVRLKQTLSAGFSFTSTNKKQ